MKYKFTSLKVVALLASICTSGHCQSPDNGSSSTSNRGQMLIARAAEQLLSQPSLDAKTRQSVDLYGQQLTGEGRYQQLRSDAGLLLRFEMKLPIGGQTASLEQVSDGRRLWIARKVPGTTFVGRVDLDRLRQTVKEKATQPLPDVTTNWLALGGLPKLLSSLATNFQFDPPQKSQLDKLPVWTIAGKWQPERLAAVLRQSEGDRKEDRKRISHLPDNVVVVLGREDLLPYRVEYRDAPTANNAPGNPQVVLELHDFQRGGHLRPEHFHYDPGDHRVADHTDLYLKNLR